MSDALLVAPHADMVLIVASAGETHWAALERANEVRSDAGIKSNGVILNRFDIKQAYGGYGYGYGYGSDSLYADQEMQQILSSTKR